MPAFAGYDFYQPYAGFIPAEDLPESFQARIRSIQFDRRDAFVGSIAHTKAERKLFDFGNKLHIVSRESTIRHRLLFAEGSEATKTLLTETEKALRSEEFLADAILEAKSIDDSTCDIRVTTFDQFTTIPGGGAKVLGLRASDVFQGRWSDIAGSEWLWWAGITESNLLGTGTKVGAAIRHDLERDTRELTFANKSLTSQKLQVSAYTAWLSDGDSLLFKIEKPLLSRTDTYAYALSASSAENSEKLYFDANRLADLPSDLAAEKSGKAHVLRLFNRVAEQAIDLSLTRSFGYGLKVDVGPVFNYRDRYNVGGLGVADTALLATTPLPSSSLSPEKRTDALLGLSLSLSQYAYQTARNYRNLKWNESVRTGWRLSTQAAMNQEWLGAANPDFHLVQEASYADAWNDRVYLEIGLSWQSFLMSDGNWHDGQADAWWEGQWKPAPVTSTVLTASWTHLVNTPQSRQLLLGEIDGLNGFPSYYFAGQARFLATAEQRLFPAFEFLTLVPAFSAILSAGNTYPDYSVFDPADLHYSLGLGLRLGRSKSTQKIVQHINVVWPLGEANLPGPVISVLAKASL